MPIEQLKDVVDYGIIGLLIFLSFITFAYAIERLLYFNSIDLGKYTHKLALEIDLSKRLPTIASIGIKCTLYWSTWNSYCYYPYFLHHR